MQPTVMPYFFKCRFARLAAAFVWAISLSTFTIRGAVSQDVALAGICRAEATNNQCPVVDIGTGYDNMCYFKETDMKANREEVSTEQPITTADGDNPPADSPQDDPQPSDQTIDVDDVWDDVELFPDQYGEPCANVPVDKPVPHREFVRFRDKRFKNQLLRRYRDIRGAIPKKSLLNEVFQLKELEAGDAEPRTVHNRFALVGGVVWIDLGDRCHQRIRVDQDGYQLVEAGGPAFERHKHQNPLPEPERGGTVAEVVRRISAKVNAAGPVEPFADEELLPLCWMNSALLQIGPTPFLVLSSPKGSKKTTRASLIRDLLDPCKAPVQGDSTRRDLPLTLYHNAIPTFDNLTKLTKAESDAFCRAVTGTGQDRRQLYTNTDEIILEYRRPIIMTAIGMPSLEPDFFDRCLVLHGERLDRFRSERSLRADYERDRPRLFGAILDLLVKVMRILPTETESGEFRMADFALCGRATVRALGLPTDRFDDAYRRALHNIDCFTIEGSDLARAVVQFAAGGEWVGTATELLQRLRRIGREAGMAMRGLDWPVNEERLSAMLSELIPSLASFGVVAEKLTRRGYARRWRIARQADAEGA